MSEDTLPPINALWIDEHLAPQFREIFEVRFDSQDRLIFFGRGTEFIELDPDAESASRAYGHVNRPWHEEYKNGKATAFDAWEDSGRYIDFWLWAELRVLQNYQAYLFGTGGGYHLRESERRKDPAWFEGYLAALRRVDSEVESRRRKAEF